MKTVQDLINEERNRKNPKFDDIGIIKDYGGFERYSDISNLSIDKHKIEFDSKSEYLGKTYHVKVNGVITESHEIIN